LDELKKTLYLKKKTFSVEKSVEKYILEDIKKKKRRPQK